jgi:hypothetical protein
VQGFANPAFLGDFLCSGLLRVAPYCVPGGISVVSKGPVMHRGRYTTSGLSLLSPFPECDGTPHLLIAAFTGYRVWADMPP